MTGSTPQFRTLLRAALLVSLATAGVSCGGDDTENLSLLDGQDGEDPWSGRRAQMNIEGLDVSPFLTEGTSQTPAQLAAIVASYCREVIESANLHCSSIHIVLTPWAETPQPWTPPSAVSGQSNACQVHHCQAEMALCTANFMMEVASGLRVEDQRAWSIPRASGGSYDLDGRLIIPVQDLSSRAGVAHEAYRFASRAAVLGASAVASIGGAPLSLDLDDCTSARGIELVPGRAEPLRFDASFAALTGDALSLAREAADLAGQFDVAFADRELSENPDHGAAALAAWTAPVMSRGAAARRLIGGPGYNTGSDGDGFRESAFAYGVGEWGTAGICPVPEPVGGVARAIDLIREAAPDPSRLFRAGSFARPDVTQIVEGIPSVPFSGLRDRLVALRNAWGTPIASMAPVEFLAAHETTELDMLAAVEYLRFEAAAFRRDLSARLPPKPLPGLQSSFGIGVPAATNDFLPPGAGGVARGFELFASTGTNPGPLPPTELARIIRHRDVHDRWLGQGDAFNNSGGIVPTFDADYAERSVANVIDYVRSALVAVGTGGPDNTFRDAAARALTQVEPQVAGRLEVCGRINSSYFYEWDISIYGDALDNVRLVTGLDSLRCLLAGSVDGGTNSAQSSEACHVQFISESGGVTDDPQDAMEVTPTAAVTRAGFAQRATFQVVRGVEDVTLYAVRPNLANGASRGTWEVLASVRPTFSTGSSSSGYCYIQPLHPELEAQAAAIFAPAGAWCGRGAQGCAGLPFDTRIPLEDDLSSDGDPLESSWRSTLAKALDAAEHADRLADLIVEQGVGIDARAETALEGVQKFCGGSVNLTGIETSLFSQPRGGTCSVEGALGFGNGMICRGGRYVRDVMATLSDATTDTSASALSECLGDQGVQDFVSLGTTPLCLWQNTATGRTCEGARDRRTADNRLARCPYEMDPVAGCGALLDVLPDSLLEDSEDYVLVPVVTNLGLFADTDGMVGEEDEMIPPCDLLREYRLKPQTPGNLATLLEHPFFQLSNVARVMTRLGWEARVDDYSALMYDGVPWRNTGNPTGSGPGAARWPCDDPYSRFIDGELTTVSCEDAAGMSQNGVDSPSLFCATAACGSNRLDRVRMNHRMGRAALAMMILSGKGTGNLVAPFYQRDIDFARFEGPAWPENLAGELAAQRFEGVEHNRCRRGNDSAPAGACAGSDDRTRDRDEPDGHAYCIVPNLGDSLSYCDETGSAWTALDDDGTPTCFRTGCTEEWADTVPLGRRAPMIFANYESLVVDLTANDAFLAWEGVGGLGISTRYSDPTAASRLGLVIWSGLDRARSA